MGKYYVQSGTLRTVVQAESGRKAAIWAVHQAMQQIFPLDGPPSTGDEHPAAVLHAKVRVSERGFDRADAGQLTTLAVLAEWNEMVTALDRLQRLLHHGEVSPESTDPPSPADPPNPATDQLQTLPSAIDPLE